MSEHLPIRMLHDRLLVSSGDDAAERRSRAGIVIPATASVGRRLGWGTVESVGNLVRHIKVGDRVLFDPEDRGEVEVAGSDYILLRERDIHAVDVPAEQADPTGMYL